MYLNHKLPEEKRRIIEREKFSTILILVIPIILNLYFTLSDIQNSKIFVDAGVWFYAGKKILHGKIPQKDYYDVVTPGTPYTYAFFIWLTRNNFIFIRIIFALITIGFILCIYLLAKKMYSEMIATLVVYLLCLDSQILRWTKVLMAEPIANFFFFLGMLFLINTHKRMGWVKWSAISGVFFSIAFLYRQTIACLYPGILLYLIFCDNYKTVYEDINFIKKGKILSIALIFAALLLFLVLGLLYYLGVDLSLLFTINITHSMNFRMNTLKYVLSRSMPILGLSFLAIGLIPLLNYFSKQRLLQKPDMLFISWTIVSCILLFISPRPWDHTFVHILPVAAILGARALDLIIHPNISLTKLISNKITSIDIRRILIITIVVIFTFFTPKIFSQSHQEYREPANDPFWVSLTLLNDVGDYIKNVTDPDDLVFSLNPTYLYFSERENDFFYIFVIGAFPFELKIKFTALVDEYLNNNPIKCIIIDPLTAQFMNNSTLNEFTLSKIFWNEEMEWAVSIYLLI